MHVGEMVTAGHLGGYVKGGDEATWYPDLWRWFVSSLGVRSVLDVGCGEGHSKGPFWEAIHAEAMKPPINTSDYIGRWRGVEGVPQDDWMIYQHDFTQGPFTCADIPPTAEIGPSGYDLIWCCEFVEHVEERYMANFMETFKLGRMVAMTHAEPGQQGYHHVNCQAHQYWQGALAAIGFKWDLTLTGQARTQAAKNPSPWNHFMRSGMVFVKR